MRVVCIPLRRRDGSVRDWTCVDLENFVELSERTWHLSAHGYAGSRFKGELLLMHRVLLDLPKGDPRQGDHINGNKLDNRVANLRVATNAENSQNVTTAWGSSTRRGVSFLSQRGKWAAQACLAGKRHWLGVYDTENEAASVVAAWRAEHMPFSQEALT